MEKTSRSEKRQNRQQKRNEQQQVKNNILLKNIGPKTKNQETVFRDFSNGKHLLVQYCLF